MRGVAAVSAIVLVVAAILVAVIAGCAVAAWQIWQAGLHWQVALLVFTLLGELVNVVVIGRQRR